MLPFLYDPDLELYPKLHDKPAVTQSITSDPGWMTGCYSFPANLAKKMKKSAVHAYMEFSPSMLRLSPEVYGERVTVRLIQSEVDPMTYIVDSKGYVIPAATVIKFTPVPQEPIEEEMTYELGPAITPEQQQSFDAYLRHFDRPSIEIDLDNDE